MPASIHLHRLAVASSPSASISSQSHQSQSQSQSQSQPHLIKSSIPIWICAVPSDSLPPLPPHLLHRHTHFVSSNQCCSSVIRSIEASLDTVWSVVRRFDSPQTYKHFLKSCDVIVGNGDVGTLREVRVVSGLPAELSRERLEILDDEEHVISFSVVGGDHRLENYRSVTTVHREGERRTVVAESYVVDTPVGNTAEETTAFVDTIVKCNLQSLASIAEGICSRSLD